MKRRNPTIKSVVVSRRKMQIIPGETMYVCEAFGGYTFKVLELTNRNGIEILRAKVLDTTSDVGKFWIGKERDFFPGDLGVPGYAYDNRPCSLFTTKAAAKAHGRSYWDWIDLRDKKLPRRVWANWCNSYSY